MLVEGVRVNATRKQNSILFIPCVRQCSPCFQPTHPTVICTVYLKKYAHGFVLCFVVVMQSFIMNSHELFIHIHQGCFAGTGAIVRLPQCQWSKPDGYEKISQCITTTRHSKAKTVCIFLGIYCSNTLRPRQRAPVLQSAFSNLSSCMKIVVFWSKCHWTSTPLVQLTVTFRPIWSDNYLHISLKVVHACWLWRNDPIQYPSE